MEVPDDQGLLVVNLDNCISSTAGEQVMKGECVYAVAVASNTCDDEDETVIQIPMSVHCSEGAQQQFTTVTELDAHQQYGDMQAQHFAQINVEAGISCLEAVNNRDGRIDEHVTLERQDPLLLKACETQCEDTDSYYAEIYNYLNSQILPDGATEGYKKLLKKKACNYKISNGILYYGHKEAKRVITQRIQQMEILKDTHVEKHTGVHLGLKKMYTSINDSYFWKGLYVDVANYVRQCKQCSESAIMEETSNEETRHVENSKGPDRISEENSPGHRKSSKVWQKVELNVYGPYPRTANQNEFIITITDPFSRWIVAHPISNNYFAESISSFVFKTFCTFGFAQCNFIGLDQELFEAVISKYHESISHIQDTLITCNSMLNTVSSVSPAHNALSLVHEDLSECVWVRKLWDEFVAVNFETWDLELEKFLFKYCTSANKETMSPFSAMFDRSPVSCLEEDKENCNVPVVENNKPADTVSKRRRLQSSILQCRHCEEIFTSKISFRIHQRKHTEEARRQGTLEGQEPLRSTSERERKLLRRTALKRKQRILKHGITKKDKVTHTDAVSSESISVEDPSHFDENTNSTSNGNVSEIGLLSLDTESIHNTSSPSTPILSSNRNDEDETFEENSCKDFRGSKSICQEKAQVDRNDHCNDINLVVYTDADTSVEKQDNMRETNGESLNKIDENSLNVLKLEAKSNSLQTRSKRQNEHGTLKKNVGSTESFQCDFCGRKFNSKMKLGIHIEKHSNPSLEDSLATSQHSHHCY